jgi:hypothetical protein
LKEGFASVTMSDILITSERIINHIKLRALMPHLLRDGGICAEKGDDVVPIACTPPID